MTNSTTWLNIAEMVSLDEVRRMVDEGSNISFEITTDRDGAPLPETVVVNLTPLHPEGMLGIEIVSHSALREMGII